MSTSDKQPTTNKESTTEKQNDSTPSLDKETNVAFTISTTDQTEANE
jgi:hypothetical protein